MDYMNHIHNCEASEFDPNTMKGIVSILSHRTGEMRTFFVGVRWNAGRHVALVTSRKGKPLWLFASLNSGKGAVCYKKFQTLSDGSEGFFPKATRLLNNLAKAEEEGLVSCWIERLDWKQCLAIHEEGEVW